MMYKFKKSFLASLFIFIGFSSVASTYCVEPAAQAPVAVQGLNGLLGYGATWKALLGLLISGMGVRMVYKSLKSNCECAARNRAICTCNKKNAWTRTFDIISGAGLIAGGGFLLDYIVKEWNSAMIPQQVAQNLISATQKASVDLAVATERAIHATEHLARRVVTTTLSSTRTPISQS